MMKKGMKIITVGVMVCTMFGAMSTEVYARIYNSTKAQTYLEDYAIKANWKNYYTFNSDCTNFASQVAHAGGLEMKINYGFAYNPMAADIDRDYDENYWYSDRHNSTLTVLSHTWDGVDEFRRYMKNKKRANVYTYSQTDDDWDRLKKKLWIGDVVQCGDRHSIIIQEVNSRTDDGIRYAAHSINVLNKKFSNFKQWCNDYYKNEPIYLIQFK